MSTGLPYDIDSSNAPTTLNGPDPTKAPTPFPIDPNRESLSSDPPAQKAFPIFLESLSPAKAALLRIKIPPRRTCEHFIPKGDLAHD